jgi:hypothetical protein
VIIPELLGGGEAMSVVPICLRSQSRSSDLVMGLILSHWGLLSFALSSLPISYLPSSCTLTTVVVGRKEERKEVGEQVAREDKHEEDEESATNFSPSYIMLASVFIMVLDQDIFSFYEPFFHGLLDSAGSPLAMMQT